MLRASSCIAAAVLGVLAAHAAAQVAAQVGEFRPVTDAVLANPDPADWLMVNRTFDQQRYSPLDQVNQGNVGQLRMAWSRGLPNGTQESTPIVYRGVMYLYAPGASIQAVDATNGDLIWEYQRDYPRTVTPAAARSKSLGIYEDMIYFAAPDGFLLALDAKTGKLRWETKVDNGGQTAGGLLVADAKVITNRTCEQSQRENCFIAAHDARAGKEVWRVYTTAAPGEPGGDTWAGMPVQERAASPWGLPGSYDPKRKVLYWGIANPNPYTRLTRHGRADAVSLSAPADLYSNSTVALDVETSKLLWYYQQLPGDDWDADNNQDRILVRTRVNPDKLFWKDGDKILGCYHNTRGLWSIAYHPGRNSLYVPFQDQCLTMTANGKAKAGWGPRAGVIRPGSDPSKYMNLGKIDLATGELRVLYSQPQASVGSALVTAGDLVFWGDQNRRLRAFDADDGKVLWEAVVGGMVMTSTISYAVNGKQYVMVFTGEGQSVTAGPLGLTQKSMPRAVRGHNSIFVFALP